jgi:hypothetical protein
MIKNLWGETKDKILRSLLNEMYAQPIRIEIEKNQLIAFILIALLPPLI